MLYDITTYRLIRVKVPDDEVVEKHSHTDYFQYSYVLNGKGRANVGNNSFEITKYDLVLAPPNIEHEIFGADGLIKLDIKFTCSEPVYSMLCNCGYLIRHLSDYEDKLIRDIFDEAVNAYPMYEYLIDTQLLELVFRTLMREKVGNEMSAGNQSGNNLLSDAAVNKFKTVIDYIKQNLDKVISVGEMAEMMGYSESYFSTNFKKLTGYAPSRYVNVVKVEKAKELMLYTSESITQIAGDLGFESVHYFSKVFKQITGKTPSNYMNRSNLNMIRNISKDVPGHLTEDTYEYPALKVR